MPTIQSAVEAALHTALRRQISVVGSGRTDAGVHARGQVAHFVVADPVDPRRLFAAMNGLLPNDIVVRALETADDGFHARYSARLRSYAYQISTTPRALDRHMRLLLRGDTDFERMNRAADSLLGSHEFSSYCRTASETKNRNCVVERAIWVPENRPGDWRFEIEADRFLHGMVRAIVGTLIDIGRGKRAPDEAHRILSKHDRRAAGPAAAAYALILESVTYDTPFARS